MGHDVTVYEQRQKLGGMLRYGIPSYRLPREILDHEINGMMKSGFKAKCGVSIGNDIKIEDIRKKYDAIYVAIGAQTDRKVGIDGEDASGVISAVELLRRIGDDEYPDFTGMHVAVIGGGNVAMDVARTSIRCGAKSVHIMYRRRIDDMTALPEEVQGAIADGCEVMELDAPLRIEKDEEGKVAALWVRQQMTSYIKDGRPSVKDSSEREDIRMPCDLVLVAVGQGIDSRKFGEFGLPLERGRLTAFDTSQIPDNEGIFAGGDCVTGPATCIRAIAAGKVAAANIDEYLGYFHAITTDVQVPPVRFSDNTPCGRINMHERPADERRNDFKLMELGMTREEACQESGRCLHCDHFGYGVFKGGRDAKW